MKNNIFIKLHSSLLFLTFFLIVFLSAITSFTSSDQIFIIVSSPFYIVPWFFLAILIISYPWLDNVSDKFLLSYFIKHIPFILLFFAVLIAFMTNRNVEYSLSVGEALNLNDLKKSLLFKEDMNIIIRLDDFKIERHSKKDRHVKSYKSEVTVIKDKRTNNKTESSLIKELIEVNNPLKINNLKIHQKSWSLGIQEIRFEINHHELEITEQKDKIIKIKENQFFEIFPLDIIEEKILYKWNIKDKSGILLDSGIFKNDIDAENKYPPKECDFKLVKEDFKLISIFEFTYRRANLFLTFAAVFFILMMFMDFFGFKLIWKLFNIKKHGFYNGHN